MFSIGLVLALLASDGEAALSAARAHLVAGRPADALEAYKSVNAAQHDRCAACLVGMAEAQLALAKPGDAAESCRKALGLGGTDPRLRALVLNLQGVALTRQGRPADLDAAETALRAALEADPTLSNARYNLGYLLLRRSRDDDALQQLRLYLDAVPTGRAADQARQFIQEPRRARERFAPGFAVDTLDGTRVSLADLHGRVVLLDFWATWCAPCRAAIPELRDLGKKYPPERLSIISVNVDDDAQRWRDFVARNAMPWAHTHDRERTLQQLFGVNALPTYVVIDADGVIASEIKGTDPRRSIGYRLRATLAAMPGLANH